MQSSALDRLKMSQNLAKTGQKQGTGCGEANTSIDYFLCMCMITFDQSSAFFGVFRPIQCNLAVVFGSIGEIFSFRGNNCEHTVVWWLDTYMLVIKCFSGCTNSGRIYRNKHCIFSIEYPQYACRSFFHTTHFCKGRVPTARILLAVRFFLWLGNWIDWTGLTELDPLKFAEIWLVSILFVWSSAPIFHLIQCALDVLPVGATSFQRKLQLSTLPLPTTPPLNRSESHNISFWSWRSQLSSHVWVNG